MGVQTLRRAKPRWYYLLLAVYDVVLAVGALWGGLPMLKGFFGQSYAPFPPEWVGKLPFESWMPIGCIAMFFALGNAVAAILCLISRQREGALLSLIMGVLLAAGMAAQVIVLGESYLATGEFLLAAFLQIIFGLVLLIRHHFVATATEHVR